MKIVQHVWNHSLCIAKNNSNIFVSLMKCFTYAKIQINKSSQFLEMEWKWVEKYTDIVVMGQIWHVKQMDWFCLKCYCKLPIVKLMYPGNPPQLFSSAFLQHSVILSQRVLNMFTIVPPLMIVTLGMYPTSLPWILVKL